MNAPKGFWTCPECGDLVVERMQKCPHCNAKSPAADKPVKAFSLSSVATSAKADAAAHQEQYEIKPAKNIGGSNAASFIRILAWILWIGGVILALTSSNVTVVERYGTSTEFSFQLFFTTLFTYGIFGGLAMCAAELFENVQRIADALTFGMKVTRK